MMLLDVSVSSNVIGVVHFLAINVAVQRSDRIGFVVDLSADAWILCKHNDTWFIALCKFRRASQPLYHGVHEVAHFGNPGKLRTILPPFVFRLGDYNRSLISAAEGQDRKRVC